MILNSKAEILGVDFWSFLGRFFFRKMTLFLNLPFYQLWRVHFRSVFEFKSGDFGGRNPGFGFGISDSPNVLPESLRNTMSFSTGI